MGLREVGGIPFVSFLKTSSGEIITDLAGKPFNIQDQIAYADGSVVSKTIEEKSNKTI